MGRPCKACRSPERDAIDKRILAGEPIRTIAAHFQIGHQSLVRHRDAHLTPARVEQAEIDRQVGEAARRLDLLAFSFRLQSQWNAVLRKTKEEGDTRGMIMVLHELGLWLERHAKLRGMDLLGGIDAQAASVGALSDDELRAVIAGMRVKVIDSRPD